MKKIRWMTNYKELTRKWLEKYTSDLVKFVRKIENRMKNYLNA